MANSRVMPDDRTQRYDVHQEEQGAQDRPLRNPKTEIHSGWPDPIDDHTLHSVMEIGPQPGQPQPLGCQPQPPDAPAGWCGLWCRRLLRDPREQADCRPQRSGLCWCHPGSSAVPSPCCAQVRRLTAWGHGCCKLTGERTAEWQPPSQSPCPEMVGSKQGGSSWDCWRTDLVSSRSGWSQPSWGRQAPLTTPKDSLTTCSMCGRTQSSTADSFSRRVGAGSSMHGTLAEPWTSLHRSADVTVENPSRVGTAAGSGSSSRGGSCCCKSSRAALIAVTLQWKNFTK